MTKKRKWHQATDGEWIAPKRRGYKEQCCDCGLTHTMYYRLVNGQIQYKAIRDKKTTAAIRRAFRFTKD